MSDASFDPFTPRGAFREVPYMGVIFVVAEAVKLGFYNGHPDWSNLGQGQPEVGEMDGAPPRFDSIRLQPQDHAYGPLEGIPELRECVAEHYNRLFRRGKGSQYGAENVSIVQGGRLALTRAMAAIGPVNVGYQLPDYTAYEDLFNTHLARIHTSPIHARAEDGFRVPPHRLEQEIEERGLLAWLVSNPCNPTGSVIAGEELRQMVAIGRRHRVTLLLDEFYSHFIYNRDGSPADGPVSAAAYVDDVNADPVVLIDGLTKNYRYPGWRVGWAVGPREMVESMARTASAIDGGPSRWAQRAAIEVLEPARADQETTALRHAFAAKRNVMLERLKAIGVRFPYEPESTFYCFGDLSNLAPPFNDAMSFFRHALDRKVMTVPGQFFDVNPGKFRRAPSPYSSWMRFSFGPPMENMQMGLGRLEEMVRSAGS